MAKYNRNGEEIPDPTPVEMPVGLQTPPTMEEMLQMFVRGEMSRQAQEQGFESFEEANDFGDEEDDVDALPLTSHELRTMIDEDVVEYVNRRKEKDDGGKGRGNGSGSKVDHTSAGNGGERSGASVEQVDGAASGERGEGARSGDENRGRKDSDSVKR